MIPSNRTHRMVCALAREFVCKHCSKTEAVHPDLPPDYVPGICVACGKIEDTRRDQAIATLFAGLGRLADALNGKQPH